MSEVFVNGRFPAGLVSSVKEAGTDAACSSNPLSGASVTDVGRGALITDKVRIER